MGVGLCQMLFLHLLISSCNFLLQLIVMMDYIDFLMLSQSFIPWINPTWLWCVILFIRCWICFVNILLRISVSVFMRDLSLLFSCIVCIWFGYQRSFSLLEGLRSILCYSPHFSWINEKIRCLFKFSNHFTDISLYPVSFNQLPLLLNYNTKIEEHLKFHPPTFVNLTDQFIHVQVLNLSFSLCVLVFGAWLSKYSVHSCHFLKNRKRDKSIYYLSICLSIHLSVKVIYVLIMPFSHD